MRPETLLEKLEALDAFRRPERFEQFLLACEADARGRTGFEDRDYPQADYFRRALQVTNTIDIQPLINQGLKNEAMAQAIKKQRLSALENFKADLK